jgi:2-oxoacid:acceptor oxidoreductase delta subunit (pyruvate/2-ketoisovalerate family)
VTFSGGTVDVGADLMTGHQGIFAGGDMVPAERTVTVAIGQSCGNCFGCDNCYGACPDNAVIKTGPGGPGDYEIDYDYCKGCGICAAECPCGAIAMVPEEP